MCRRHRQGWCHRKNRPCHTKARTAVLTGLHAGIPLMRVRNAGDNRQSQAIATGLAIAALIQSVKRLKHLLRLFGRNAHTVIGHTEAVFVGALLKRDLNMPMGEFFGIVQQITQCTGQQMHVTSAFGHVHRHV